MFKRKDTKDYKKKLNNIQNTSKSLNNSFKELKQCQK